METWTLIQNMIDDQASPENPALNALEVCVTENTLMMPNLSQGSSDDSCQWFYYEC